MGSGPEAHFLSPTCVLYKYFSGSCAAVVDEHFAKALGHKPDKGEWKVRCVGRSVRK